MSEGRKRKVHSPEFKAKVGLEALRTMIKDAVTCHFDLGKGPGIIWLHFVRDEVIAA